MKGPEKNKIAPDKNKVSSVENALNQIHRQFGKGSIMRLGADNPVAEIEAAKVAGEELSRSHQEWVDAYFARSAYKDVVGAFEGAGYCSEGMYRAELDCIMFTKGTAINLVITGVALFCLFAGEVIRNNHILIG